MPAIAQNAFNACETYDEHQYGQRELCNLEVYHRQASIIGVEQVCNGTACSVRLGAVFVLSIGSSVPTSEEPVDAQHCSEFVSNLSTVIDVGKLTPARKRATITSATFGARACGMYVTTSSPSFQCYYPAAPEEEGIRVQRRAEPIYTGMRPASSLRGASTSGANAQPST